WFLLGAAFVMPLYGCSDAEGPIDTTGTPPTYYQDIKPIIDEKCTTCHIEGGVAPFALTDYESILPHTDQIKTSVGERTMPPWPPAGDCTDYQGDRSLSETQTAMLIRWVDEGALEGDLATAAGPIDSGSHPSLTRADVTLSMPADYISTQDSDD